MDDSPINPMEAVKSFDAEASENYNIRPTRTSMQARNSTVERLKWVSNPHIGFRHPLARMIVVCTILGLDFYLYGEDPVNDSYVEANLPGLGHLYNFVLTLWRFPDIGGGIQFLRLCLILLAAACGAYLGRRWVHHRFLRDYLGLSMFTGCRGTFFVMGGTTGVTLILAVGVHNMLMWGDADSQITGATGMQMRSFGKLTQSCSATADIVAIIQIFDTVLQDRYRYPAFLASFKKIYIDTWGGWVRVVMAWVALVVLVAATIGAILATGQDGITWDSRRVGGLSEVGRTCLLSIIVFCDLFTVFQDWEFPTFQDAIEADVHTLVAGTFQTQLSCNVVATCWAGCITWFRETCLYRLLGCVRLPGPEFFQLVVTGQWLTYGPLFCVVCLDLFCTRTQVMYEPKNYGQYVDINTQRVWTIVDTDYLALAYTAGTLKKADMITYAARRNTTTGLPLDGSAATDVELNSIYLADSESWATGVKYLFTLPGLSMIVGFICLVGGAERLKHLQEMLTQAPEEMLGKLARTMETVVPTRGSASDLPADGSPRRPHECLEVELGVKVVSSPDTNVEPVPQPPPSSAGPDCMVVMKPTDSSSSPAGAPIIVDKGQPVES
eukprot:TRINITY_DN21858_c0_g1_i1.p1 TRINITY_DN21858_c0_g1~~TRINITY_DN21858_c0_g1_i1.p1  ORF type:complete len:610 (-),score=40.34 TRINITY_DN21858_c0_g1_i1:60-1889(-)